MRPQYVRLVVSPTSHQQNISQHPISLKPNQPAMFSINPLPSIRLLSSTTPCNLAVTPTRIVLTPSNSTLRIGNSIATVNTNESLPQKNVLLPALSTSPSPSRLDILPSKDVTPSHKKSKKFETPSTKPISGNRKKTHRKIIIEQTGKPGRGQVLKIVLL